MNQPRHSSVPRWLHGWAILTVAAALPLLILGAEVTTKQVGMADTTSLREPWYLFTLSKDTLWAQGIGLVIEHSHRTAGWLVGICSIVLAIGMWFGAKGSRVRGVGLLALLLVVAQGLLGIFRVKLNAWVGPEMAMFHGLFAQIVFATLLSVAIVTSRNWLDDTTEPKSGLRALAGILMAVTLGQIVFGALVRHQLSPFAQRVHVLFAFAVVAAIAWLVRASREEPVDRAVRRVALILAGLVCFQVALGVESWLRRFGAGVPVETVKATTASDLVRTAHFFVGALLFSGTVAVNLLLYRPNSATVPSADAASTAALNVGNRITAPVGGTL
jgi:cytochrome c oxidase assembly protein subunit 15